MQLEPWITRLKPFVHRFVLVHVLRSKMRKSARVVHSLKSSTFYEFGVLKHVLIIVNMQLETWMTFLKPFVHRFALVNVLCSRMRKSARFVHSLKSSKFMSLEF